MGDEHLHEVAEGDKVIWKSSELHAEESLMEQGARVAALASVEPVVGEEFDLDGRKLRAVVAPPMVKSDCELCVLREDLDRCLQVRCEGDLRCDGNYVIMKDVDE